MPENSRDSTEENLRAIFKNKSKIKRSGKKLKEFIWTQNKWLSAEVFLGPLIHKYSMKKIKRAA